MKRVFAIAISLLGGGITAYNVYAIITDPGYYAGSFMVSSATFTALGLALLCVGIWWNVSLTKRPDAGDKALKFTGVSFAILILLTVGIVLTVLLISLKVFDNSAIVLGFVPIPGQIFYAAPIVASILVIIYILAKRK